MYGPRFTHLFLVLFFAPVGILWAYETDQYSVSPYRILDSGEGFSKFIFRELDQAIIEVNKNLGQFPDQIQQLRKEVEQIYSQFSPADQMNLPDDVRNSVNFTIRKLEKLKKLHRQLQSEMGIVEFIQSRFSLRVTWQDQRDGVFGLPTNLWPLGASEKFFKFHPRVTQTIYSLSGFHRLISPSYFVFSGTYNMFGVHLGWDKIGHILNQGFQYYEVFHHSIQVGDLVEVATQKAIDMGSDSEDGVFGQLVDGVYSNADLAANFAGFLFFKNFFDEIYIGNKLRPPFFLRDQRGFVSWNPQHQVIPEKIMKDFITDHLDESLNPNLLEKPQRGIVRWAIQKRCESWKAYYGIHSYSEIIRRVQGLKTWDGYNYGNRSDGTLRIEEICFSSRPENDSIQ